MRVLIAIAGFLVLLVITVATALLYKKGLLPKKAAQWWIIGGIISALALLGLWFFWPESTTSATPAPSSPSWSLFDYFTFGRMLKLLIPVAILVIAAIGIATVFKGKSWAGIVSGVAKSVAIAFVAVTTILFFNEWHDGRGMFFDVGANSCDRVAFRTDAWNHCILLEKGSVIRTQGVVPAGLDFCVVHPNTGGYTSEVVGPDVLLLKSVKGALPIWIRLLSAPCPNTI